MSTDFYSAKNQLQRELRGRWRQLGRGNLRNGTILTLLSFYALHSPGHSQVYDVTVPYAFAALHLAILVFSQTHAERSGRTAAFFLNLPRERVTTFIATTLFFLGHAFYYQLVIAVGIYFKLGGADITPVYRLHPEIMTLPFLAVFAALWYCHKPRMMLETIGSGLLVLLALAALVAQYMLKPQATPENNFLPPRDSPLGLEWVIALLLLAVGIAVCWRIRGEWSTEKGAGA